MANTKASLTQQNTQTYPSNTSGSITANAVKSFNNNFINAVATLGDTNVFTEPQTFGDVVQVNSDVIANNVYAGNIPYLSGSNVFTGPSNTFSGSVFIQSASIVNLEVQNVYSQSTIYSTGSNQLGDASNDTQTLWGTVDVKTGPLKVSGSVNVSGSIVATSFTGSLQGTSSWANNVISASHALTSVSSSFANNATSASYALNATSASYVSTSANGFPFSGSAVITGSLLIENINDVVVFGLVQSNVSNTPTYAIKQDGGASTSTVLITNATHVFTGSGANLYRFDVPVTIQNTTTITGSTNISGSLTLNGVAITPTNTGSLLTTASVSLNTITFTKGDASTFAITVDTGSGGGGGMNLGANTFTGSQTLSSSTIPASLVLNVSGALSNLVTESNGSTLGFGNVIFNSRTGVAQTGSTIISGAANIIFYNGAQATAPIGLSGINNIGVLPLYSGSIPVANSNYFGNQLITSGSLIAVTANNVIGASNILNFAGVSPSASFGGNYLNASAINISSNYFFSGAGQFGNQNNNNNIAGQNHRIEIAGSGSQVRQFVNNFIGGASNTASLITPTGSFNNSGSLLNTFIYGTNLIVSGTQINTANLHGAAFVGRFNQTGSGLNDNTVVFAVGAGTNAARRTSFLVSGSGEIQIRPNGDGQGISTFGPGRATKIADGNINGTLSTVAATNAVFNVNSVTNNGSQLSTIMSAETSTNTSAANSVMMAGASLTMTNGTLNVMSGESNQMLNAARSIVLGGVNNVMSSSYGSAIIGGSNVASIRMNTSTGSVALPRDAAYTASANYTLFTQNVNLSGSLVVNGNTQYNFGEFFSTASVTPSAGVSQSVVFDTTVDTNNVAISGSGALIKITNAGTYNIQFSIQVNTSAGADTLYVWYKKNGTNISNSASKAVLANNTAQLLTVNIIDSAAANDYYEVAYQTANGNAQILAEAASGNIPAIPSVILTVTQVR